MPRTIEERLKSSPLGALAAVTTTHRRVVECPMAESQLYQGRSSRAVEYGGLILDNLRAMVEKREHIN